MKNKKQEWLSVNGSRILVDDVHRFGTDALQLFRFAQVRPREGVCDFGSGSGIFTVLLRSSGHTGPIYAVELQPQATALFKRTVEAKRFEHVRSVCCDLRDKDVLRREIGNNCLDLVICNPPFYRQGCGGESPILSRQVCRSDAGASIDEVTLAARRLLKHGGRFCVCFKPERLCDCIAAMRHSGLEPKRLQMVHQTTQRPPWLCLLEGRKGAAPFLQVLPPYIMK